MITPPKITDYAKHLIERIQSAPQNDRVGVLSNELLREFQRGYPLVDLEYMLKSDDNDVVAVAIWITSELGEKCRPLLRSVIPLLDHPFQRVRFWALDCLLWASPEKGCDFAHGIALLNDPEDGIRRKVLDLLFRMSDEQLRAALSCSEGNRLSPGASDGLRWLLSDDGRLSDRIMDGLRSSDSDLRKFAAVGAARLSKQDKEPLHLASKLDDVDIAKFSSRLLSD
jgi:hypothetical protein